MCFHKQKSIIFVACIVLFSSGMSYAMEENKENTNRQKRLQEYFERITQLIQNGKIDNAIKSLEVGANKGYISAMELLAQLNYEKNEFGEALKWANAVEEKDVENPRNFYYKGLALYNLDRKNEGEQYLIKSAAKGYYAAHSKLGDLYRRRYDTTNDLADLKEALSRYEEALSHFINDSKISKNDKAELLYRTAAAGYKLYELSDEQDTARVQYLENVLARLQKAKKLGHNDAVQALEKFKLLM